MRLRLIVIVISSAAMATLAVSCYYAVRKYGISIELTRNAAAKAKSREIAASDLLRHIAANPKLTMGAQTDRGARRGKQPEVLAVVNRGIVTAILNSTSSPADRYRLLAKLRDVDVESVIYRDDEIPALTSELIAVQSEGAILPFRSDLSLLIGKLKGYSGQEIIFY